MKKALLFFMTSILFVSLMGCGQRITYTKEFPYLPAFKNMELEEFQRNESDQMSQGTYIVKGASYDDILNQYEEILEKDGWKTTDDKKPAAITMTKDEHIAIIISQKFENGTRLLILSK